MVRRWNDRHGPAVGVVVRTSARIVALRNIDRTPQHIEAPGVDVLINGSVCISAHDDQISRC